MDVTERIERLLEQRKWTIYRLGKESGVPQSTLSHIFRNDSEPTISTLESICRGLGISLVEFFSDGELASLTTEQRDILNKWAKLSAEQKQLVLDLISNMR